VLSLPQSIGNQSMQSLARGGGLGGVLMAMHRGGENHQIARMVDRATPGLVQRHVFLKSEALAAEAALKAVRGATGVTATMEETLTRLAGSDTLHISGATGTELAQELKKFIAGELDITPEQQKAVNEYQGGGFRELNAALRSNSAVTRFGKLVFTQALLAALEKLPKFSGVVFRMLSFPTAKEYNAFVDALVNTTQVYTTPQFDSTKRVAGGSVHLQEKPFVLNMRIETQGEGSDIASVLSTTPDYENEVVFPPGTMYGILKDPPARAEPTAKGITESVELAVIGLDEEVLAKAQPSKADVTRELMGGGKGAKSAEKKKQVTTLV
jgi:hypothetical protein